MGISINGVSKKFHSFQAVDQINLTIPTGDFVALLGPSGSGKTTLLRLIAGLELPNSGQILFNDLDYTNKNVKERKVGFVFQHYALFKHMTIFENIAFGLKVRPRKFRPSKQEIKKKVYELLELVQLKEVANRYPSQLSGGQRQRIALARALAVDPEVLLLDEPFGALDAKVRQELRIWLRELHQKMNITTIFVTHDQEEALEMADTIVVMNQGKVEQIGTPQQVYDRPKNAFVYSFLGRVNEFRGEALGTVKDGCHLSDNYVGYLRPHEVHLSTIASDNSLPVEVFHVHSVGASVRIEIKRLDNDTLIEAELSADEYRRIGPFYKGDRLYANCDSIVVFQHQHILEDSLPKTVASTI
ncbi:sulfate/molybdate ABC transporter ATP-binding protein [Mesobacillus maritimus]|uniref:Sulfate ABC transporter ATP-binding protein n=1 Tax=Mesobacillus maritimus TaxID=1643336 RepID=A0ABS7KC17_9BACI|nr:sulfate ABC transporter ATP-binding protein [Mesobacillus maritimus]MBY0099601.1 sulfate ABC transporter ATP-binding protein [Mesobacillus maritimus]